MVKRRQIVRKKNTRPLNGKLFTKRLKQYLPEKDAEELAFHLGDIDDSCEHYRGQLWNVFRAMPRGKSNSLMLDEALTGLAGEIEHLRWHAVRAARLVLKIDVRKFPPLDDMTDLEYTKYILAPSIKWLDREAKKAGGRRKMGKTAPTRQYKGR